MKTRMAPGSSLCLAQSMMFTSTPTVSVSARFAISRTPTHSISFAVWLRRDSLWCITYVLRSPILRFRIQSNVRASQIFSIVHSINNRPVVASSMPSLAVIMYVSCLFPGTVHLRCFSSKPPFRSVYFCVNSNHCSMHASSSFGL